MGPARDRYLLTRTGGECLRSSQVRSEVTFEERIGFLDAPSFIALKGSHELFRICRPKMTARPGTYYWS